MLRLDGLVPARFLSIMSHLTLTMTLLMAREENVSACLPLDYTDEEFQTKDTELAVGLGVAAALMLLELLGFFLGISMFIPTAAMISILCHSSASVALAYMVFDSWDCDLHWLIVALCSAPPAVAELCALVGVGLLKRGW
ncbi:transmembrane protein 107-like [Amphibalanus amphitrite]|uniref:transmembrane protein 107-like n=1 Tax=Amphibalanus amphitrite TaxID=1232801 RepID=UPI001C91CF1B|nr:transmembrane protein 107-like [Amphibalanus amphitrite]XP_043227407.1 transmembrane protein 107-like [Amphibalanus amphitrite]XP_043227419.1 transmembrane protein 107-like [Amphibalanus amphitrite]